MGGGNSKPKDIKQLCKETHLTEKQIKQWYTDFCKVSYVKQSLVPDVNLYQSRICFEICLDLARKDVTKTIASDLESLLICTK